MTFPHNLFAEYDNKISAKLYLEFAVHLLELGFFESSVFCHDNFWFDVKKYTQVTMGFLNLLLYLDSCGMRIETSICDNSEIVKELFGNIMRDSDKSEIVTCYELHDVDLSNLNMDKAVVPQNCIEDDFSLVRLYLTLKTGAALNKKAIENILHEELTDAKMLTLRKQLQDITGHKINKRNDNSYEMR